MGDGGTGASRADGDRYAGPSIAGWGGPPGWRWIWVANGIRPPEDVFTPPRPLRDPALRAWDRLSTDEATVNRIVESFRVEAHGLGEDDPLPEESDEDERWESATVPSHDRPASSMASRTPGRRPTHSSPLAAQETPHLRCTRRTM